MLRVQFTRLEDGTTEDYRSLEAFDRALNERLPNAIVTLFKTTHRDTGYPVSPMEHALQTATRAYRDRADDELVVAALFHDIGDLIAPDNHARVGAEILRPYVSERTHWVLAHHAIFQGYYYWHHIGRNRNEREKYREHPHFEACADFCARWDQVSFDPAYDTMPLEAFMPLAEKVLSREPNAL